MGVEKQGARLSLECIEPNAAGIDVGARSIYVAVGAEREAEPVRCFATFTEDLRAMAAWLKQCGITTIAMESTGVYWIPVYEVLEDAGFKVCLVNSHHVKHVPGRKSDVSDCQWLQYLHSVGLLGASFRPERELCALRALSRHRAGLVEVAAIHVQHMQKALTQMNLQIHHVLSDITGMSGLAVVDAILAGQRDPQQLAGLVQSRVHADRETVSKSLVGNYRAEHLFTLGQSLEAYRQYQKMLVDCDREMEQYMRQLPGKGTDQGPGASSSSPHGGRGKRRKNQFHFDMGKELYRVLGTDLTLVPGLSALTVHTLVAEAGPDLSRFANAAAFTSWLALCPGSKKSGGKVLSSKTRKSNSRLSLALRLAAQTLHRSQSYLGAFYRRLRSRLGAPQAITATAHKLARIIYHLVTTRTAYDESVFRNEEQKQALRSQHRLQKQAKSLGFQLVPISHQEVVH
jgi:transposase